MLFIDYSSAFNTIVPSKLIIKLGALGLNPTLQLGPGLPEGPPPGGKQQTEHAPIHINGTAVEKVESFKFLGIHITDNLKWSTHTDSVVRMAQQPLFNLRRLKKFGLAPKTLRNLYRCILREFFAMRERERGERPCSLIETGDRSDCAMDGSYNSKKVLPQRPGFRHHRKENYVCRDALSRQSTECSEVQEVSQSQLQQPRVKLNGSTVETPSHHDLHRELLVSTKRGLLPGEKPELKRVLEQRRLEQHREQELALQPPLELETELRKRQQILLEHEQEEVRRREEQEREVPEFVRVKDNLRRTQVSGQ
ncbi:uncharacterized protein LOC135559287 [Oncorhynchus masou masou]|uniref:uncharacterized protein LOC135559287 n=1 Tax=Oncorhynchus masou masou TaxID=90313 RepID=UPI00318454B0